MGGIIDMILIQPNLQELHYGYAFVSFLQIQKNDYTCINETSYTQNGILPKNVLVNRGGVV